MPNSLSKTLKKNRLLLLLLLPGFTFACGSSQERALEEEVQTVDSVQTAPVSPTQPNTDKITGLIRSSGLQPQEAQALGLSQGGYQLISQEAYFLEGHDSLKAYLGECITLSGQQKDWETVERNEGAQTTYNRRLFVVEGVYPENYATCYFSDTLAGQPQGRAVNYSGTVERMQRPAPDIAYDYQLRLQEPYRDANHPVEPGKLVKTLPLFAPDFEVMRSLETAVRRNIPLQIKGRQQQGYAEREAVWVISADTLILR